MKKERIVSLYVDQEVFEDGAFDVTQKLYQIVPEDEIDSIKYMVPSSTENGIYFTIVLIGKKDKDTGRVGFQH